MPYYYKDKSTNKIWSNAEWASAVSAKPIKEAYRYYSMLDTTGTPGSGFQLESFYIKDGSVPWFDVVANDGSEYNPNYEIDVHYGYMPVIRLCNSSISGKYYINNGSYVIPYGMTPMLYKTEIAKGVDSGYSMEHTMVDYSRGGKVSWRMSEENLRYFQPIDRGPTTEKLSSANSAHNLKNEFKQINDVFRNKAFVYPWYNTSSTIFPIDPSLGVFINSKPDYNTGYNAFDFTEVHNVTGDEYAPANFTLTVSSITAKRYNKLKVKMDALYLYMNGISLSPLTSYNEEYVNNANSFSADSLNSGTTPYCQALFYAINEDLNWSIPHISKTTEYIGNGEIYSNLSKPITNTAALAAGKLVVSNPAEYTITPISYNDCTVKEIQELSNINVWNHMILQQVMDNVGLTSTFSKFKFYNKRTGKTFQGFIPTDTIKYVTANSFRDVGYELKTWDDTNWNDPETLPSTTSINGCYSYKNSEQSDFPNYRQLLFGDDTKTTGNMWETNFTASDTPLKSLSSYWLMYSDTNNRNNPYYYGHTVTAGNIVTRLGIIPNTTFDLIYKNSTFDKYKNVIPDLSTEQQYKTTGYTPSAGICYSYTNVKLEHTIDLTNETRKYLHIAYPFSTVFYNSNGLLEQMIMTYEAEK